MYVYVVMGSGHHYHSNVRKNWPVCAYNDEKMAEEHAIKAEDRVKEIFDSVKSMAYYDKWATLGNAVNEWDPNMKTEIENIQYFTVKVPTFPVFQYFRIEE